MAAIDTGTTDLLADLDAGVLTLTLNRPEARNAMSGAMNQALARQLAWAELGPKPEHEIQRALEREVTAERWTRLDAEIDRTADALGVIDLRPQQPGLDDPQVRRLMIGRLQHLETMGAPWWRDQLSEG